MVKKIKEGYSVNEKEKVLILSSSALTTEWGNYASVFSKKLNNSENNWEVYNASGVGFSSLDNLNTYLLLKELHFDYVLFYNGINDSRINNCPPELFNENYNHLSWNNEINTIQKHAEINITVIPFFLDYYGQKIKAQVCPDCFIAENYHEQESWQSYGADFKSLLSFDQNCQKIIEAKSPESKLLFVSFATYIPENYSFTKFANQSLDYNFHKNSREVEVWGSPKNVANFMLNLNNNLATHHQPSSQVYYYDIRDKLTNPVYFADVCHFSEEGIDFTASYVADSVLIPLNLSEH